METMDPKLQLAVGRARAFLVSSLTFFVSTLKGWVPYVGFALACLAFTVISRGFLGEGMVWAATSVVLLAVVCLKYFRKKKDLQTEYGVSVLLFLGLCIKALPLIRWGIQLLWPLVLLEVCLIWVYLRYRRAHPRQPEVRKTPNRFARGVKRVTKAPFIAAWWFLGPNPKYATVALTVAWITVGSLMDVMSPTTLTYTPQAGVEEFLTKSQLPPTNPVRAAIALIAGTGAWENYARGLASDNGVKGNVGGTAGDFFYSGERKHVYLLTGHSDDRGVKAPIIRMNRETGEVENVVWAYNPYQGACSQRAKKCVVLAPCARALVVLDDTTGEPEAVFNTEVAPMFASEAGGQVTISSQLCSAKDGRALVDDVPQFQLRGDTLESPEGYPWITLLQGKTVQGMGQGFTAATADGSIFYGGDNPRIVTRDGQVRNLGVGFLNALWGGKIADGGAYDAARREIFVASPFTGILVYNESGELQRVLARQIGFRPADFDPGRRILYAANYIQGKLLALDVDSDVVLHEWVLGDSIRSVHYYSDTDEVFVSSASLGFFIVHPGEVLGGTYAQNLGDQSRPG